MFEIKKELLATHEALLNVEIEENAVKQAMQKAARTIAGKVNIPGFRKGKAPYAKVVQYVGEGAVRQEAADQIIEDIYPQIIDRAGIEPYGPGVLEKITPSPLTYTIRVPLEPEVKLGDYHSLRQPWEEATVSEEEVANVLEQLRSEHVTLEPLERPAQWGDEVYFNLVGTADGEIIVDEDDIEIVLQEDAPFITPDFVEALLGMHVNEEKTFSLVLPEDFREPSLRGVEMQFDVKLTGVYERVLPDLDDALASTVGPFETLEDLKRDIYTRLKDAKHSQFQEAYRDSLVEALVAQSEVHYPPDMVKHTLDDMVENAERRIQRERHMSLKDALQLQGMTLEQFRQQLQPRAEADIKRSLVLVKFAAAEGIQVRDDEVVQAYNDLLMAMGTPEPVGAERVNLDSEFGHTLRLNVLTRKTLEHLEKIARGELAPAHVDSETAAVSETPAVAEQPSAQA